jgi:hypothetical protein
MGTQNWLSVRIAFAIDCFTPHPYPFAAKKFLPRSGGDFTTATGEKNTRK